MSEEKYHNSSRRRPDPIEQGGRALIVVSQGVCSTITEVVRLASPFFYFQMTRLKDFYGLELSAMSGEKDQEMTLKSMIPLECVNFILKQRTLKFQ